MTITHLNESLTPLLEYSSEEKIVGKWIDGRPVYERTFTGVTGSFTYNNKRYQSDAVLLTGVKDLVSYSGIYTDPNTENRSIPSTWIANDLTVQCTSSLYLSSSGYVTLYVFGIASLISSRMPYTATVRYTKRADS